MMAFYHYTSSMSAAGIQSSGCINETPETSRYAHHGRGVYLTRLAPIFGKSAIARNNWTVGGSNRIIEGKVDYAICVNIPISQLENVSTGGRDLFVHRDCKMDFYHYTDKESADAIEESLVINETPAYSIFAHHGRGVYGTSMAPSAGKHAIAKNNWRGGWSNRIQSGRLDYAIRVTLPKDRVEKCPAGHRNIYVHRGPIDLSNYPWKVIKVGGTVTTEIDDLLAQFMLLMNRDEDD